MTAKALLVSALCAAFALATLFFDVAGEAQQNNPPSESSQSPSPAPTPSQQPVSAAKRQRLDCTCLSGLHSRLSVHLESRRIRRPGSGCPRFSGSSSVLMKTRLKRRTKKPPLPGVASASDYTAHSVPTKGPEVLFWEIWPDSYRQRPRIQQST